MSIFSDSDVAQIATFDNGRPSITNRGLTPADEPLALAFVQADMQCAGEGVTLASMVDACCLGVRAWTSWSDDVAVGWRKFVLYQVGESSCIMWDRFHADVTRIFADWTLATLERNGWGADGRTSPLGEMHSWCMGLAHETGGGIYFDPVTGQARAATVDEAVAFATARDLTGLLGQAEPVVAPGPPPVAPAPAPPPPVAPAPAPPPPVAPAPVAPVDSPPPPPAQPVAGMRCPNPRCGLYGQPISSRQCPECFHYAPSA